MNNQARFIQVLVITLLVIGMVSVSGCVNGFRSATNVAPATIDLYLSKPLSMNEASNLTVILTSDKDIPSVESSIILPTNINFVDGDLKWSGDLKEDVPTKYTASIIAIGDGPWPINVITEADSLKIQTETNITNLSSEIKPIKLNLSTKITPTGLIYMNETEFYGNTSNNTNYQICFHSKCFTPEPLKGEELNNYFKSLNLVDDPLYVRMQFDVLGADPKQEHINILESENVILLGYGSGGHTMYAKVPKSFLETKSYDFVRWIGVVNASDKLDESLYNNAWNKNCSGNINVTVEYFETLTTEQYSMLTNLSEYVIQYYTSGEDRLIGLVIDATKLSTLTNLNFVKTVNMIPDLPCAGFSCPITNPFKNLTCEGG